MENRRSRIGQALFFSKLVHGTGNPASFNSFAKLYRKVEKQRAKAKGELTGSSVKSVGASFLFSL